MMNMTPNKPAITILIPSVEGVEASPLVNAFTQLASKCFFVQFVFLINSKSTDNNARGKIEKLTDHEILTIPNDRYFGSCEENLYRAQDFFELFNDIIFCVGEHDYIDWDALAQAVDFFLQKELEAMGWNINSKQKKLNGEFAQLNAIAPLNFSTTANKYCQLLLSNEVIGSATAYPALISCYGPIDWAAYLGNHLFKKEVFRRVLQYKFSESVYSFVYKQLKFFTSSNVRYAFYATPVIHRISSDFLKLKTQVHSFGWLENHRTVHGLSSCFWIANLQYLNELKSEHLFKLVTNSLCLAQTPNSANEEITYAHIGMLSNILNWSLQVLRHHLVGKSYYFPDMPVNGGLNDVWTVYSYLTNFVTYLQPDTDVYSSAQKEFIKNIELSVGFLGDYLATPAKSTLLISHAINEISECAGKLESDKLIAMNTTSFEHYLRSK